MSMQQVLKESRLYMDSCALAENEKQNTRIEQYRLFNPKADCRDERHKKIAECNYFNYMNGYGYTDACNVDMDSRMRIGGEITDHKIINEDFRKCGANVCEDDRKMLENRMRRGNDYGMKSCDTISEINTLELQFTPMIPVLAHNIQYVDNVVEPWLKDHIQPIGEGTRDVLQQKKFLESIGYKFIDGIPIQNCGFQPNDTRY